MFFECDCSVEPDNYASVSHTVHRTARRQHTCGECRRTIEPGERYEVVKGCWEGSWSTYKTCLGCERLRDRFCSHGFIFTELPELLEHCLGFDYTQDPKTLEEAGK